MSLTIKVYNEWRDYNDTIPLKTSPGRAEKLPYLELLDKSCNHKINEETETDFFCGKGFIKGRCKNGHHFVKRLYCQKEWCPICGKDDSVAHKRRMARWEGKVLQMEKMGYLVVTIPEELRAPHFSDKKGWNALRRYWIRRLRREGYERGLSRWHWFGDKNLYTFHPHLNFLFEEDRVSLEKLDKWREDYKKWLENYCNCKLDKKVDIHYLYAGKKKYKKFHWLKYVTRATFLEYDAALDAKMFNYHAMITWGGNKGISKNGKVNRCGWEKDNRSNIENGLCPVCGNRIHWEKQFYPIGYINLNDYRNIGNEYWIDKWSYDYDPAIKEIIEKK